VRRKIFGVGACMMMLITISIYLPIEGMSKSDEIKSGKEIKGKIMEEAFLPTVLTYFPTDDTYLGPTLPGPNGKDYYLVVSPERSGSPTYALLKFNIFGIPPGATINWAKLKLCVHEISPLPGSKDYTIHRITKGWDETTTNWAHLPSYDNNPTYTLSTYISSKGAVLEWDVTRDVQDMVDGIWSNYGWLIKDVSYNTPGIVVDFYSKEYYEGPRDVSSYWPKLEIGYTHGTQPPSLTITDPLTPVTIVDYTHVHVKGYASDDAGLQSFGYTIEYPDGTAIGASWPLNYIKYYNFDIDENIKSGGLNRITIEVSDADGNGATASVTFLYDHKPNKPTIAGPTQGKVGVSYIYSSSTTDPDGDDVYYWFDWGDGSNTGWIGPVKSGESWSVSHSWTTQGDYAVRVKAKDQHGVESEWSDPLIVTMPKSKIINHRFMDRLLELLPFLGNLLDIQ